ncbi:VOC family protein [Elizabethkingia meningoseptica]|uniref:phosphoribosylanthranilate isomerase n=1 Tax=Elizabethkingia meningoseptica TaxID=238 RepID=UPI0023BE6E72|nr:VOC family protein [Elizabethkingia meningoseptica]MDE5473535.1 VOC family protein [Elizabethkingia meningoseptica]MDE5476968.1 VOC family protein [Elizabethkingia meningoseptica]MDE5484554.1 VOC family protein [Elizabethkingia meningoseptica]MDE5500368.1 VOC family protein [Elizabethkingia meningoseptica]
MKFRYARHTADLDKIKGFYTSVFNFDVLGTFKDHDAYDGIFLGKRNENWHLEFTISPEKPKHTADEDDLLVFYPETVQEFDRLFQKIKESGISILEPKNPYWKKNGVYIKDPDGYGIMIVAPSSNQSSTINHHFKLKVCGLTKQEQIQKLKEMDIDFLGFIFYEKSPRYVLKHLSLDYIAKIEHKAKAGVFVNEEKYTIINIARNARLNYVQLHGDEDLNFIKALKESLPEVRIIKVFRIGNNEDIKSLRSRISEVEPFIDLLLFDTDSKAYGGTGERFNWRILNELSLKVPYLLSGGVSSENVSEINNLTIKPDGLDINSKFEIGPGDKDLTLIQNFIQDIQQL